MISTDNNTNTRSFSRELSEFVNNNLVVLDNTCIQSTQKTIDSEKTIDLGEILINDQGNYSYSKTMPLSDLLTGNHQSLTTLTRFDPTSTNLDACIISDSNDSDNTYESDEPTTKRKVGNVKRLSTTSSTNSSLFSIENNATGKAKRGGRRTKRIDSSLLTEAESLARFGNKYVPKGTAEYDERRNKNNDAVKKCRAKLQVQQLEREKRLKELTEENRKLSNTVESLNKELSVLKGILSTMKPQYNLPTDIEEKIRKLESMVMANNNNNNNFNAKS
jgi:hypothetical protein